MIVKVSAFKVYIGIWTNVLINKRNSSWEGEFPDNFSNHSYCIRGKI